MSDSGLGSYPNLSINGSQFSIYCKINVIHLIHNCHSSKRIRHWILNALELLNYHLAYHLAVKYSRRDYAKW